MPCPFTGPKMFCAGPIFWASLKIWLHLMPVKNNLCKTKRWFAFSKIVFCASTKVFEEALNSVKFLDWLKKFGLAQNILGPLKGQGISIWRLFAIKVIKSLVKIDIYLTVQNMLTFYLITWINFNAGYSTLMRFCLIQIFMSIITEKENRDETWYLQ